MELLTHSKTGLMKRIDRYRISRKKKLPAHIDNADRHNYMNTRLSSIRYGNNYQETKNNSPNLVDDSDNTLDDTHTTVYEEPKGQFPEEAQLIGNTHEILKYIIQNENIHSNDPKDVEKFVSDLPKIEGISYDRVLNCFRTKIPVQFTNRSIEHAFGVEVYGLKNAWLKAIGSLYTNIATLVFDCPAIPSNLKHNIYSTINDDNGMGITCPTNGHIYQPIFSTNAREEVDDWSDRSSSCSSNSYGDLLINSVDDIYGVLNIVNKRPTRRYRKNSDNKGPHEGSKRSRSKRGSKDPNDPKRLAESLKPWHPHIYWIPSICRWRTMYYDANNVKHSKTFTPACFGGVREAYYAAIEFRNMIDSMDFLMKERERNQLEATTPTWEEQTESLNKKQVILTEAVDGVVNFISVGSQEGLNDSGNEQNSTDSEAYEEREDEIKVKPADSGSYKRSNGVKNKSNRDAIEEDKFSNLIRCDQSIMENINEFIARNTLGVMQSDDRDELNGSTGSSDASGKPTINYSVVNYKKCVSRIKIAKRGRPGWRGRVCYERTNDYGDNPYQESIPYGSNLVKNGDVLEGISQTSGYDANFLSGLDKKGLYIPIPSNWETK